MLRLIAFFFLVFVLTSLLGHLPIIGPLFGRTGLFGLLLVAALLSVGLTRFGERMLSARRLRSELEALGAVGSAHNRGKMGALFLARGRPRGALEHLEAAVAGEPEVAEWHYRLGLARQDCRDREGALESFERCCAIDEEYAYGGAQMRRAECQLGLGRSEESLEALVRFERNHGPSPEAAYRRGLALRALGKRAEARAAFGEVGDLARQATRYQKREAGLWALRAGLARFI